MKTSESLRRRTRAASNLWLDMPFDVWKAIFHRLDSSERSLLRFVSKDLSQLAWDPDADSGVPAVCVARLCTRVATLSWAVARGCPLDARTFASAGSRGQIQVLSWLLGKGCKWDARTCTAAVASADEGLGILPWLHEHGCPWDTYTAAEAAGRGNLELLQWLVDKGCPVDESSCSWAADGGHLQVFRGSKGPQRICHRMRLNL